MGTVLAQRTGIGNGLAGLIKNSDFPRKLHQAGVSFVMYTTSEALRAVGYHYSLKAVKSEQAVEQKFVLAANDNQFSQVVSLSMVSLLAALQLKHGITKDVYRDHVLRSAMEQRLGTQDPGEKAFIELFAACVDSTRDIPKHVRAAFDRINKYPVSPAMVFMSVDQSIYGHSQYARHTDTEYGLALKSDPNPGTPSLRGALCNSLGAGNVFHWFAEGQYWRQLSGEVPPAFSDVPRTQYERFVGRYLAAVETLNASGFVS